MIDRVWSFGELRFEWDEEKAQLNVRKHRVRFEEAATVFGDPFAVIFTDEAHTALELRELIIGQSEIGRLLLISFTERPGAVRIISARKATRFERKNYERRTT